MSKKSLLKKVAVVVIVTVFFITSVMPSISGINIETNEKQNIKTQKPEEVIKKVTVNCYNFGMSGAPSKEIEISQCEAEYLYGKIKYIYENKDIRESIVLAGYKKVKEKFDSAVQLEKLYKTIN